MGGAAFGIAEAACVFVWVFYRKRNPATGQRREDRVKDEMQWLLGYFAP